MLYFFLSSKHSFLKSVLVHNNKLKLSYSKSDVFSKKYVQTSSTISNDTLYKSGYQNKDLNLRAEEQKIVTTQKINNRRNLIKKRMFKFRERLNKTIGQNSRILFQRQMKNGWKRLKEVFI